MAHLLIIDDEPAITAVLGAFFERHGGHTVSRAHSGLEGVDRLARERPDLTLLDLRLPDISGFEVLQRVREYDPVVIMITAYGDIPLAVEAMKQGAENFLTKPVDLPHLAAVADRALEKARLKRLNALLRAQLRAQRPVDPAVPLLGRSATMRELAAQVELLASSEKTLGLLIGESGTGKGRIARLVHTLSRRGKNAFVEVNCAALTAESLDAELFGYERGAFAGAAETKPGLFEVADDGTVFLDEVGDLAPDLQPKLLGVLDGKSFRRLGGTQEISTHVRLLAASSKDLVNEVNAGRFREDLYYRLAVMPVSLPPLRARAREDLVELVASLIEELRPQLADAPRGLTDDALDRVLKYSWPGNIRELRNTLERAMLVARGAELIAPAHLPADVRDAVGGAVDGYTPKTLLEVERAHIHRTLRAHNLNRTRAAKELGISRATLIKKIKQFGLTLPPGT